MSVVEELKGKGNDLFRAGKYTEAVEKYTAALDASSEENDKDIRKVLFSNRKSF
jgi:hypothetical protein